MKFDCLTLGDYSTNCYLVWNENKTDCVIIDPGYEPDRIAEKIAVLGLTPVGIFLTHGHFDHVGGVAELKRKFRIPVYLHERELELPPHLTNGPIPYSDFYKDGEDILLGGLTFRVIHTPGHTPGSVSLLCETSIFSGDTLFAGVCGRTDLAGGNIFEMISSLRKLKALPGDYAVYPGHGNATSLDRERNENPYMR